MAVLRGRPHSDLASGCRRIVGREQLPEAGHSLSRCVINPRREQRAHCRRSARFRR